MIWFFIFQLLGLIGLLLLTWGYCRLRKKSLWSFIWQYFKWVLLAEGLLFVVITLFCWQPLYNTAQCHFRGVSMKTDTKYSWYLGECQVRTTSGSYVPIRTTRGLPDGHNEMEQELY